MSKESVIALESYEKHSFFRFFFIFVTVSLFLSLSLSSLYYYKERNRYFQEQKTQNKLAFSECEHLKKLLPSAPACVMEPINIDEKISEIYADIFLALIFSLTLILPLGYLLAKLSLRPIQQSVETMDSFINGIVHDINTPLSIIRINAQSMISRLNDEKLVKKNNRIIQGVDHIEALEEQLLFVLRIHHYQLQRSHFDLFEILQQRQEYWSDIRHSVSIKLEGEVTAVNADADAIKRMIDNIVSNAIKYSCTNGEVKITCKNALLEIKDRGEGIKKPKEVFNKYYRESNHTKGLGLGLYIVKEIASMHNVEITVDSEVGYGTSFSLNLKSIASLHNEYIES